MKRSVIDSSAIEYMQDFRDGMLCGRHFAYYDCDLKKWVTTLDSVEDAFKAGMLKMLDSVGKYIPEDVKKGLL